MHEVISRRADQSTPSAVRRHVGRARRLACPLAFVAFAAGCASGPGGQSAGPLPQQAPLYRCDHQIEFTARFVDDSVLLDSTRGYEVLYRDAGGVTPAQRFYSNPKMKAEFGLGNNEREAVLRYPLLPLVARCVRD
ncbi:MAG: hypothetical protein Q7T87_08770 [Polaromonas sp.]|nr:hypothetical protein [Polaromonas sp.]